MGRKPNWIEHDWLCKNCKRMNPSFDPNQKKKKILLNCPHCNAKRPVWLGNK